MQMESINHERVKTIGRWFAGSVVLTAVSMGTIRGFFYRLKPTSETKSSSGSSPKLVCGFDMDRADNVTCRSDATGVLCGAASCNASCCVRRLTCVRGEHILNVASVDEKANHTLHKMGFRVESGGWGREDESSLFHGVHIIDSTIRWRSAKLDYTTGFFNRSTLLFACRNDNINHFFHDQYWRAYVSMKAEDQAGMVFSDVRRQDRPCSAWGVALTDVLAKHYRWPLHRADLKPQRTFCTMGDFRVVPTDRELRHRRDLLGPSLADMRSAVWGHLGLDEWPLLQERAPRPPPPPPPSSSSSSSTTTTTTGNPADPAEIAPPAGYMRVRDGYTCHALVYTRRDTCRRRMMRAEVLADALRAKICPSVALVHAMPKPFDRQVRLFANASLVVGLDGGWASNVLWMPPTATAVSLQLVTQDSWQTLGTEQVLQPLHVGHRPAADGRSDPPVSRFFAPCLPPNATRRPSQCPDPHRSPRSDDDVDVAHPEVVDLVLRAARHELPPNKKYGAPCPMN